MTTINYLYQSIEWFTPLKLANENRHEIKSKRMEHLVMVKPNTK